MSQQENSITELILNGLKNNVDRKDLYFKALQLFNYDKPYKNFSKYVSNVKKRNEKFLNSNKSTLINLSYTEQLLIDSLKKKKYVKINELSKLLSISDSSIISIINDIRKKGYELIYFDDKVTLSNNEVLSNNNFNKSLGDKEIIFGVASDLHFGSKSCQITALNEFAHICKQNDVKYIFSPGDIVAGSGLYPGQMYDVYAITADKQEQSVIQNLPAGFKWIMIGGNHDYSFIKKGGGHNPLLLLQNYREDIKYVGFDEAVIPILNNVDLMMWHPSGGVPYSISYRLQKGIEQIAFDELKNVCNGNKEKPTLRFVLAGHLHIQMQAMFGSIFGMQCGTFEGTTNYLKRKGLSPSIGGWIVKACLGNDGLLKNFEAKFHMFPEIENDWKSYKHELNGNNYINTPIFE